MHKNKEDSILEKKLLIISLIISVAATGALLLVDGNRKASEKINATISRDSCKGCLSFIGRVEKIKRIRLNRRDYLELTLTSRDNDSIRGLLGNISAADNIKRGDIVRIRGKVIGTEIINRRIERSMKISAIGRINTPTERFPLSAG